MAFFILLQRTMATSLTASETIRAVRRMEAFCEWVTSTDNRLYVGWFGVLMIPCFYSCSLFHRCVHSSSSCRHRRYVPVAGSFFMETTLSRRSRSKLKRNRTPLLPIWEALTVMSGSTTEDHINWLSSTSLSVSQLHGTPMGT